MSRVLPHHYGQTVVQLLRHFQRRGIANPPGRASLFRPFVRIHAKVAVRVLRSQHLLVCLSCSSAPFTPTVDYLITHSVFLLHQPVLHANVLRTRLLPRPVVGSSVFFPFSNGCPFLDRNTINTPIDPSLFVYLSCIRAGRPLFRGFAVFTVSHTSLSKWGFSILISSLLPSSYELRSLRSSSFLTEIFRSFCVPLFPLLFFYQCGFAT